MVRPVLLSLVALVALAACGGNPPMYLLPSPAAGPAYGSGTSLAVADIGLPAYAEANEVAMLSGPETIDLDRGALWADTPRRALTRHLVAALGARLGSRVLAEPWPGFDPPSLRLEVATDRIVGAPGGVVQFTGQYVLVAPGDGTIFASDRFAISVPVEGEDYPALLAAHAVAIERLADQVAARITGRRPAA